MELQNESDNLVFRLQYLALEQNPHYPNKQLWQIVKEKLQFLNSISELEEVEKIIIHILTFDILEKIVSPRLDEYVNGEIEVSMEEVYGEDSHIAKKIYGSDFEKQSLLDREKITILIDKILYLPINLLSNLEVKDIELIKKQTEAKALYIALDDKKEEDRKKIDNMINSYIQTCISFKNYKPTNVMLEAISGVKERFWKKQRANPEFLSLLMKSLKSKHDQAKTKVKKDFWWKSLMYVETKIEFLADPDKFKTRYSINDNKDYEQKFARSKGSKIRAQERIREKLQDGFEEERTCNICGKPINNGSLCKDCYLDVGRDY